MNHMPYERMEVGDMDEDPKAPKRDAPSENGPNGPGRTPGTAEAGEEEERRMPQGEPGPTPGMAEGEDSVGPSRH